MKAEKRTVKAEELKPPRLPPLFNDAFLKIFGSANSTPVTQPLLNAILRAVGLPEIEAIERISADTSLPGGVACKSPRLDVLVVCDDGRLVDLEAQRSKVDLGAKSLFYAAKLLAEHTKKDSDVTYSAIPQVIVVVLLDESKLFPKTDQFLSMCRMTWNVMPHPAIGPDNIIVVLAELEKVRMRYNGMSVEEVLQDMHGDESLAWLYLLAEGYKDQKEADAIMSSFPTMEEFAQSYGIAMDDPDLKRAYDRYWESTIEYNSIMEEIRKEGTEQGLKEGRERGLKEGREDLAHRLQELGVDEAILTLALNEAEGKAKPITG